MAPGTLEFPFLETTCVVSKRKYCALNNLQGTLRLSTLTELMALLLTLLIIGMVLLAWLSVFKIIPSCYLEMRSYKLWRLRDKLADAIILHQELEDDLQARHFLVYIEKSIQATAKLGPLNTVILHLVSRKSKTESSARFLGGLEGRDRTLLSSYLKDYEDCLADYSIWKFLPRQWVLDTTMISVAMQKFSV